MIDDKKTDEPQSTVKRAAQKMAEYLEIEHGWKSSVDYQWTYLDDGRTRINLRSLAQLATSSQLLEQDEVTRYETDPNADHGLCLDCGSRIELVRPGKHQCPQCG